EAVAELCRSDQRGLLLRLYLASFGPLAPFDRLRDRGSGYPSGTGLRQGQERAFRHNPIASRITAFTFATSYFASAISRLRAPIAGISAGSSRNRSIAAASGSTVRGGTRNPFSPSTTVSRHPGASVVTTGRPVLIASSTERGVPSRYDGSTYTLDAARNGRTSFR